MSLATRLVDLATRIGAEIKSVRDQLTAHIASRGTISTQNANSVNITGGTATLASAAITATTASTASTNGALVVAGGVGVGGQITANQARANRYLLDSVLGSYDLVAAATGSQTFYVSPTGSNSNSGSLATPFSSIQYALDRVASIYWGPYTPTIQLLDGTFPERIALPNVFGRSPTLQGNLSDFTLTTIDATATALIAVTCNAPGAFWRVRNFVVKSASNRQCFYIDGNAAITGFGPIGVQGSGSTRKFDITNGGRYTHANSRLIVYDGSVQLFRVVAAALATFGLQIEAVSTINFSGEMVFAQSASVSWVGPTSPIGSFTGKALTAIDGSIVSAWNASGFGETTAVNSFVAGGALSSAGSFSGVFNASTYTVAQLQAGLTGQVAGATAFCTNDIGGSIPVFFDGTSWRRMSDRAIISTT